MSEESVLNLLERINNRPDNNLPQQYRSTGRVISRDSSGTKIAMGDGSVLNVRQEHVFTNSEITNKQVVVIYPRGGDPMLLSEVRG